MNLNFVRRDWRFIVALGLLLAAFAGLQQLSHGTPPMLRNSLAQFPYQIAGWGAKDFPIEEEVQRVLGASDLLNRVYQDPQTAYSVGLFVAFFESQRKGGAIHSPKNCLPGSGWSAVASGTETIAVAGHPEGVQVNRYVVQKDTDKQIVLYWYQSQGRVIASEYYA
ncbi:MAG: EpsI family protein, partial [Acidobacteria bacterium]|nr:EpsI family protein [Acidobacteriota bacterium]